jgi:predicted amidohydrolase
LIADAGARGIELAAFGETWLPGYPFHASLPEHDDLWFETASDYLEQAVLVPSHTTDQLCKAARLAGIDVVIGIVELDPDTLGTAYCTLLFIGKEGEILGKHRKLKPTAEERIVWGQGDGTDLDVYQRSYGRISGLNCWEHQMLLPGYALIAQGTQIHIAAWPGKEPASAPAAPYAMWPRQLLLSRAFASQGACNACEVSLPILPDAVIRNWTNPKSLTTVIPRNLASWSVLFARNSLISRSWADAAARTCATCEEL